MGNFQGLLRYILICRRLRRHFTRSPHKVQTYEGGQKEQKLIGPYNYCHGCLTEQIVTPSAYKPEKTLS